MLDCSVSAWPDSASEVADISSAAPAFCWITLSSCWMAWFTWLAPISCSRQAALISSTSSAVFLMSGTSFDEHGAGLARRRHGLARQRADLGGRRLAPLGELPHLRGDHRKALAVLARPRRLDGRVQREKVGLARDLLHEGDLLGDGLHGVDRAVHGVAARLRVGGGLARDLLGLGGVVGVLLDVGGHLLHGRGDFLGGRRLLVGAGGELLAGGESSSLPDETLPAAESASLTTVRSFWVIAEAQGRACPSPTGASGRRRDRHGRWLRPSRR